MMLEKQRKKNNILMLVGGMISLMGLLAIFLDQKVIGIIVLIVGVSVVMVAYSVSSFFFKIDMKETFENSKKKDDD